MCRVPWAQKENDPQVRFRLIIIDDSTMEWVESHKGNPPAGHVPVDTGGRSSNDYDPDLRLAHAITWHDGLWIPGKAGAHIVSLA